MEKAINFYMYIGYFTARRRGQKNRGARMAHDLTFHALPPETMRIQRYHKTRSSSLELLDRRMLISINPISVSVIYFTSPPS